MTNAFADVIESTESDDSDTGATDDESFSTVTESFTDMAVRTTLPHEDEIRNDERYENADGSEKADDVDARKLFRPPTINELRYYAREGPYGETIITKPIEDIFKHGFEVNNDPTEDANGRGKTKKFLDQYKVYYKKAEIKSRRDGLCLLEFRFSDPAESTSERLNTISGGSFDGFKLWTIDNLSPDITAAEAAEYTDYDDNQLYVSEGATNGGVVIVDDVSHPDHGDIVGYGIKPRADSTDVHSVHFLHASRVQKFTWNEHVDGHLGNTVTGEHVGESVLTSVLQPLKGAQMGYWALTNILFRYSAPLHAVEPPEGWGEDEWEQAQEQLGDISMASDALLPPGSELNVAEGVSEFDPEPIYETLVESICGGTVFVKTVLQGTQTGTVSGSETDLKGYFNNINLLRTERAEPKFKEAMKKVSRMDQETIPRLVGIDTIEIDWGPLFKISDLEKIEGMVSVITAATNGIKNYVLKPDEARSLVEEKWAELDTDVDLGPLSEEDLDDMDRVRMRMAGRGPNDDETVNGPTNPRQNPRLQNGGGQPEGQTRESSQPVADDLDAATIDAIAEQVVEKLNANQ